VRGISLLEKLPHEPKYAAADAEVSEELRGAVTVGGGVGRSGWRLHLSDEHGGQEDGIHKGF
jgi:hypothetical protein